MAFDPELAAILRAEFAALPVQEQKMFGGICFMVQGNMIAGLHKGGVFLRVGPAREAEARALPGTAPMDMAGRPMKGMVALSDAAMADPAARAPLIAMAVDHALGLPPKAKAKAR